MENETPLERVHNRIHSCKHYDARTAMYFKENKMRTADLAEVFYHEMVNLTHAVMAVGQQICNEIRTVNGLDALQDFRQSDPDWYTPNS